MAKKTYEQAIKQLESIVEELETGDIPLEKAFKKFEDGMNLSRHCSKILDETENKVTLLMEDSGGGFKEKDFS